MSDLLDKAFDILKEIPAELNPVVAGGMPRDILFGRKPKDIDIIFSYNSLKKNLLGTNSKIRDLTEAKLIMGDLAKKLGLKDKGAEKYVNCASGISFVQGNKHVDLICTVDPPKEFIKDYFDFGLCHITLDAEGDILVSDSFIKDMTNKRITCYIKSDQTYWSVGRAVAEHRDRLLKKYPEFTFDLVGELEYDSRIHEVKRKL